MDKIRSAIILFLLFAFSPALAEAATLSILPSSGSVEVGSRLQVKVIAASSAPLNAVSGAISYPTSLFTVESVSKANSIINFWVTEPSASKSAGTIKFEGVALNGFNKPSGTVATISLRAIKTGSGKFSFQSGQVLANDGQGTDITGALSGATFTVIEASAEPAPPAPEIPPEEKQPEPTLKAPEIMLGTKYGAPAIIGTSEYSKAQTLITFVALDGAKIFITGVSDAEGGFSIIIPNSLKRGSYTVSAVMIKSDKTNSEPSDTIVVAVGSIFSDIGRETWALIALLLLAILYLLIRIYIHLKRDKDKDKHPRLPASTRAELANTEDQIHKSFKALRDDVTDRAQGIINPVERGNIEELKKDLASTEEVLTKEIKDIEKEQ